jgi:flagellar biogenesis protein FliO
MKVAVSLMSVLLMNCVLVTHAAENGFHRASHIPDAPNRVLDSRDRFDTQRSSHPVTLVNASASPQAIDITPVAEKTPIELKRSTGQGDSASKQLPNTSNSFSLWTVVVATSFVLVLILGLARLLRKHVPAANSTLPLEALEVLGKRHLDARQRIYVIRCGHRILLVGATQDSLTTLTEITDPVEVDSVAGLCQQASQETNVVQAFKHLFNSRNTKPSDEPQSHLQSIVSQIDADRSTLQGTVPARNGVDNLETPNG